MFLPNTHFLEPSLSFALPPSLSCTHQNFLSPLSRIPFYPFCRARPLKFVPSSLRSCPSPPPPDFPFAPCSTRSTRMPLLASSPFCLIYQLYCNLWCGSKCREKANFVCFCIIISLHTLRNGISNISDHCF